MRNHTLHATVAVALLAVALALAAAALPYAARRGRWAVAGWGSGVLAATLLPPLGLHALPLVLTTWLTCLAAGLLRPREARHNPV